jgi:hypothetical protein
LTKGETLEEQLTSALKTSIFLITVLMFTVTSLLIANYNMRVERLDLEVGISKVNLLFDGDNGGPIKGFIRINDMLAGQNNALKQENILFLKTNSRLFEQNHWLRLQLLQTLDENTILRENNKVLLNKALRRP